MDPEDREAAREARVSERLFHLLQGERISELHALTEAQVIEKHDALVEEVQGSITRSQSFWVEWERRVELLKRAQVYADELARREAARQEERMEALTRSMHLLSWVGVGVAIVGVILAAMTYFSVG